MKRISAIILFLAICPASASAAQILVKPGESIQAALVKAAGGDEIVLQAGATWTEELILPVKPAGATITVRTSATLPERRVTVADLPLLATVTSGMVSPALTAGLKVAGWRFIGMNFKPTATWNNGTVVLNEGSDNITYDRCLILGPPNGVKRGILVNASNITVSRSHIAGIWALGQDSQAIAGWDGSRSIKISDNYLEAASENIMFGGADPTSEQNVPQDILVEGNHLSKDLAWKTLSQHVIKNLLELKCAKRVRVRRNVLEHSWADAQNGTAIMLTPANQLGAASFCGVEDVTFEQNIIRDSTHGVVVQGYGYKYKPCCGGGPTRQTTGIKFRNNLWMLTTGRWMLLGNEVGTLTLEHNTFFSESEAGISSIEFVAEGEIWQQGEAVERAPKFAVANFILRNNFFQGNEYGIRSTIGSGPIAVINRTVDRTILGNVMGMQFPERGYRETTTTITRAALIAELNPAASYVLNAGSRYKGAGTDGLDVGWLGMGEIMPPAPPTPPLEPDVEPHVIAAQWSKSDPRLSRGYGRITSGCS